jgi:hypothetical protein
MAVLTDMCRRSYSQPPRSRCVQGHGVWMRRHDDAGAEQHGEHRQRSENDATHDDFLYVKSSGAYHGKAMSAASPATRRSPPMRRPTIVWSSSRRSLHPVPWYGVNYVYGDCTIGHIARAAGVHIGTVRYYQRRGLDDLVKLRLVLQGLVAACDQPHS